MAATLTSRVNQLEIEAARLDDLERKATASNRKVFWTSIIGLIVATLALTASVPGALNNTYSYFGWTPPGLSQKRVDAVRNFFTLAWSYKPDSIRSAIGYTAPGSDAEFYAQLLAKEAVAVLAAKVSIHPSPWKADGDQMVWCGDKARKVCERASNFKFDSDDLIKSFSLNSTDLRELLIRPGTESVVSQTGASIKLIGGFPYITKEGTRLCIVLKATGTLPNVIVDYDHAFYDDADLSPQPVTARGRSPLAAAQSTWVEIQDVPLDTPWLALPAGPAGGVENFWFPLD